MSDIDFDELDAAVASVLNKDGAPAVAPAVPAQVPAAPQPDAASITPPTTPADSSKAPAVTAADLHKPAPVAPRGRFLDMVHPSGDMARPASAPGSLAPARPVVTPAAAPVFATEPVIAPASPVATPRPTPVTPVQAPAAAPTPTPSSAPSAPATTPQTPPIQNSTSQSSSAPVDFFAASPDDSAPHATPDVPPVASPFIPDAKVEKRPLGGAAGAAIFTPTPVLSPVDNVHAELSKIESESNLVPEPSPVQPVPSVAPVSPVSDDSAEVTASPAAPAVAPESRPDRSIQPLNPIEAPAFFTHKTPAPTEPDQPKGGKGTLIWVTVAVAILLIGFGVGASLYFTVLR